MQQKHLTRQDIIHNILTRYNSPAYREKQILEAIYVRGAATWDKITTLPADLRTKLQAELPNIRTLKIQSVQTTTNSEKILFYTAENNPVESVLMQYDKHSTLCLSTQSGCQLGCTFCSTGQMGFFKNLSEDEIVDQIVHYIGETRRPNNLVFMGMGEPFANPHFFTALKLVTNTQSLNYGQRHISVSTVGLVPGIEQLTNEYPEINIAFSLHFPTDEERLKYMPITRAYSIGAVFEALNRHIQKNKRKIFVAYLLLPGINDSKQHAILLSHLVKCQGKLSYLYHVNLIKYHATDLTTVRSIESLNEQDFSNALKTRGVHCTIRQNFGEEIDAACGQLGRRRAILE